MPITHPDKYRLRKSHAHGHIPHTSPAGVQDMITPFLGCVRLVVAHESIFTFRIVCEDLCVFDGTDLHKGLGVVVLYSRRG